MKERIFNLFYYVENDIICELGFVEHFVDGTDEEKSLFLQNSVTTDFEKAERFSVTSQFANTQNGGGIEMQFYIALTRQGRALEIFEDFFVNLKAKANPLCCVTAIVNGKPEIDISTPHGPLYFNKHQGHAKLGSGVMPDYLEDYMTPYGFDMPSLIHNDYFEAIKLLFNAGHYVSCMKLLVSFIDTLAYLEHGDMRNNFIEWLDKYAELDSIGISSAQLWELRNSILHMTNLDSRRVLKGQEKRISFCVAKTGVVADEDIDTKYFNLLDLTGVIANALSKWINSYNANPNKFAKFIERYDRIISDDRHAILSLE